MHKIIEQLDALINSCDLIDLSTDITIHKEGPFQTKKDTLEPEEGAKFFVNNVLPNIAKDIKGFAPDSFLNGSFLRHEFMHASVHAGSHIDAPGHYGGKVSENSFINYQSPRFFIGKGIKLDFSQEDGEEITFSMFKKHLESQKIMHLHDKIVLIQTGDNRPISVRIIEYLIEKGIHLIGTDNSSFDGDFKRMIDKYLKEKTKESLWPCHMLGREKPYYQIERLSNLEKLPSEDFLIWAPPILIHNATASWTRILALVPKAQYKQ